MSTRPLTDAELFQSTPSIFSERPIEGVSERYMFVPTHKVLHTFREARYYPIITGESKALAENQGFQKHMVQFRSLENILQMQKMNMLISSLPIQVMLKHYLSLR